MSTIPWLGPNDPFPDPRSQPDPDPEVPGLLAVSERIYSGQLERAYRSGIFPWYSDHQPVLWWSPDPRMTLNPANLKISQSLRKTIRSTLDDPSLTLRVDHDFSGVMRAVLPLNVRAKTVPGLPMKLWTPTRHCMSKVMPIASLWNKTNRLLAGYIASPLAGWYLVSPCFQRYVTPRSWLWQLYAHGATITG